MDSRAPVTPEQLAAWQTMADEATAGEWQWYGNVRQKDVYLATVDRGRVFVMGFERWGMQGAQPRFQMRLDGTPGPGIMRGIEELDTANGPQMVGSHRNDFVGIGHPDARLIAAAPTIVRALLAEVERLTIEERKWRHAGADGIDALADLLGKAQSEVERLTGERDAWIDAAARTSETLSIEAQESEATIRSLRADLGHVEPAEEPSVRVTVGSDFRCHICGGVISAGSEAAVFGDGDDGPRPIMHWGPCPVPDLWLIEYVPRSSRRRDWCRVIDCETGGDLARPYEEALYIARNPTSRTRVRLVRCKEPRRG